MISDEFKLKIYNLTMFASLIIVGFAAYYGVLNGEFLSDDYRFIVNNDSIKDVYNLNAIWQSFITRFLVGLSFALNYHLGKLNVFGYHLFSLCFHFINTLLVYILISKTLHISSDVNKKDHILVATSCAFLFLLHPIQTQAVSFIAQRATIMAASLIFLSVILYAKARLERCRACFTLSGLLIVMGFFVKETVLVIPVLLLVYEIYFLADLNGENKRKWLGFYFALLAIFPLIYMCSKESSKIYFKQLITVDRFSWDYVLTEINVLVTYIRMLFFPLKQAAEYDYPISTGIFDLRTFFSIVAIGALIAAMIRLFHRNRLLSFAIAWFFMTKSIEFVSVVFGHRNIIYENWLYVSVVGWALFIVILIFKIRKQTTRLLIVFLILCAFFFLTVQRNKAWQNEVIHYIDWAGKYPRYELPYFGLADAYGREGNMQERERYLKKAIEVRPDFFPAYNALGVFYAREERDEQAIDYFQKALTINPQEPKVYYNIGYFYYIKKDDKEARRWFKKHLQMKPDSKETKDLLKEIGE